MLKIITLSNFSYSASLLFSPSNFTLFVFVFVRFCTAGEQRQHQSPLREKQTHISHAVDAADRKLKRVRRR
jgi:hypothetical protein